jgi:hypothetical protein
VSIGGAYKFKSQDFAVGGFLDVEKALREMYMSYQGAGNPCIFSPRYPSCHSIYLLSTAVNKHGITSSLREHITDQAVPVSTFIVGTPESDTMD